MNCEEKFIFFPFISAIITNYIMLSMHCQATKNVVNVNY